MTTIAISGASGLVGTELCRLLSSSRHTIVPVSRRGGNGSVGWNPQSGIQNPDQLAGVETFIHLAGENIASGRWTRALKDRIRSSRVDGTRNLVRSLVSGPHRPRTLISASAIGYYGDRGEEVLTESSAPGTGFLADVCREWELAALSAAESGVRVVCVRIGVVLSPRGGALAKMLLPFKMGLGGRIGNGRQYWSWIGLHDLVRCLAFCAENDQLHGPVNAVSPQPVTNAAFTKGVGEALHRPTLIPMPAFAARLVLGEMADSLLLASTRVVPERLTAAGFQFDHPELVDCLTSELGRS